MKRFDRSARARPARPRAPGPDLQPVEAELTLREVGARGDAVADGPEGPIYVPFGLAGETVRARLAGERGEILEVLQASAERAAPICAHFGACGGCQLQHWRLEAQAQWKRDLVVQALAKRRLETEVRPILEAWGQGRRRAAFHAQRRGGKVEFGFIGRGERGLVAIEACPVLAPALAAALPALQALAEAFAPPRGEITLPVLASDTGLDVQIKGAGGIARLDLAGLEHVAALAQAHDLARIAFEDEPATVRRAPSLAMGRAQVRPPPGAFLQPTAAGEALLAALAGEAIGDAPRVADLFCGVGTFALRLAERAEVYAVEGEAAMVEALRAAADAASGALKTIRAERRDLLRAPVSSLELRKIDAVVFDPPRSGARLQAEQIAASAVSRVAAIACDAPTFARDARILVDGGFRFLWAQPVDQFRHTPHVEIVGAFAR